MRGTGSVPSNLSKQLCPKRERADWEARGQEEGGTRGWVRVVKIQFTRWFSEWFCLASPRCQDDFGSAGAPPCPPPREVVRAADIRGFESENEEGGQRFSHAGR